MLCLILCASNGHSETTIGVLLILTNSSQYHHVNSLETVENAVNEVNQRNDLLFEYTLEINSILMTEKVSCCMLSIIHAWLHSAHILYTECCYHSFTNGWSITLRNLNRLTKPLQLSYDTSMCTWQLLLMFRYFIINFIVHHHVLTLCPIVAGF